jgi:hypothetical protein
MSRFLLAEAVHQHALPNTRGTVDDEPHRPCLLLLRLTDSPVPSSGELKLPKLADRRHAWHFSPLLSVGVLHFYAVFSQWYVACVLFLVLAAI